MRADALGVDAIEGVRFGPLEEVPCALCGGSDTGLVVAQAWFGEDFHVVRCVGCGLIDTNPRLFRYLRERVTTGGRLLDGGCSSGRMVRPARDHGFEATGFDINPGGPVIARKRCGAEVLASDVEHIAIDLLFRVSGKKIAGVLVATERKPH